LDALGGVAPDRALMIGDSLTSDVAGAIAAGVPICWYNPARLPPPAGLPIDHIISSIDEMPLVALK
ncbi:MAG: HAD hydrolase-like protein, partial [Clostridiales bacterium]|nr:HAD hydrolase-like protein [Clostridiales bacterium]